MESFDRLLSCEESQSRSYTTQAMHSRGGLGRIAVTRWRLISYIILMAYEKVLEKFGFAMSRKRVLVLLISFAVVIVSCLGFLWLKVVAQSSNDFTHQDSQSRRDLFDAAKAFPLLESRREQIIFSPKWSQNILSEDCLKEVVEVHQTVVNITGYKQLCVRKVPMNRTSTGVVEQECVISSPLEFAGANFEHLSNLSSSLAHEWQKYRLTLSTAQTFPFTLQEVISNFEVVNETNPPTSRADAIRLTYFIRKPFNEEDREVVNFEKHFEKEVSSLSHRLNCSLLSFRTGEAIEKAIQSILTPELTPLCVSAITMVFVVLISFKIGLSTLVCFETVLILSLSFILPLACAAGILSIAHIPFSSTLFFIPFFLLGKTASDVLLLLGEWERQNHIRSLEHRVGSCFGRMGIIQISSAFCGTVLFGIPIKSSFEVISRFYLFILVGYALVSTASFFITATIMQYEEKLFKCLRTLVARSCRKASSEFKCSLVKEPMAKSMSKLRFALKNAAHMLTTPGARVISFVLLACFATLGVLSALHFGERASATTNLYRHNDNFNQFTEAQRKFFENVSDVGIVFLNDIDYSQPTAQNQIINICKTLEEASYSHAVPVCWISDILQWARKQNASCSNSEFHRCLNEFLRQPVHAPLQQDVHFERNTIVASRIHLQMIWHHSFEEDRRSLERLRHDLKTHVSFKAVAVSHKFFEFDDLSLLHGELVFVFATGTVVVFVLCLLSSTSFVICSYITLTFLLLVLETVGIMKTWDIHLNHVTFICLYCALFLALNPSQYVAHSFVFSAEKNVRERMTGALRLVAWPLLTAALLQICGSISLGFIYPALQNIFFRLVPLVLSLGVIHAIVIFPPTTTTFVELINSFDSLNEEIVLNSVVDELEQKLTSPKVLDCTLFHVKAKYLPVSIVGIGCRFPGAKNKDLFWNLLEQGECSVGAFPPNRRQQHEKFLQHYHPKGFVSGRLSAVDGSYMDEIQTFDQSFFGITNGEASAMDPQQRILLEVVYEAIEDAGMKLEDLQKCKTGVFAGVMNLDYNALVTEASNVNNINQFSSTGITASIIANRVSFCFNLTGPSVAVDTACSSSLTALKLAVDNLQKGECDVAIVCAANIVLDHIMQMVSSMAGLLAPDGRCKSFDASGDGYGRGEGFAAIILKLSKAASNDGDDEYCQIIACGVNNDGQNARPITAPSSKMQAELSKTVLEWSGVSPEDVSYIEAHGTGTAIGDVVEVTGIADTYTRGTINPTRKLKIGSVKSNLNHTESTAGLAGLIKVALMIKKKRMVPTVNVHTLNPKLKLQEKGLVIQQAAEPWKVENGKLRVAAVNSFGYGGSNAHAILREVPSKETLQEENKTHRLNHVLTLSARSQEALKKMAKLYSEWLNECAPRMDASFIPNLCYSLTERRSQLPHRLALPFRSILDASIALQDYTTGSMDSDKAACYGEAKSSNVRLAFLFGGQGSQWYAMGRQLITCEPVFREAILNVSDLVKDFGEPWSLTEELMAPEDKSKMEENSISQPVTFAVQYATVQLLMSWKIYPSAVLGHSLGEIAAACTAGIITLREAVYIVLTRSTLQDLCPSNGSMAALGMSEHEAKELIIDLKLDAKLSIAAVNDAKSVTVSGDCQSVEALGQHLAIHSRGTFWRILKTKRAFHSHHMEHIKKPFIKDMKKVGLKPQHSKIPMYSTVSGEIIPGAHLNSDYWWRNIRFPVLFHMATKNLLEDGNKQIIEISSQPILAYYVKQIAEQENFKDQEMPIVLNTLPRKRVPIDEQHKAFLQSTVCRLYTMGYPLDWTYVQGDPSAKFIRLPNYPWTESRFWFTKHQPESTISPLSIDKTSIKSKTHPFLEKVKLTVQYSGLRCWESEIDLHRFPHFKDHALLQGGAVMPGAAYLEMAFAMAKDQFVDVAGLELIDVKLSSLLTLPETKVRHLRLRFQKTASIQEAKYDITSVQDDLSEINLSSGKIAVDLSSEREVLENEALNGVSAIIQEKITQMKRMSMEYFREITERYGFNYGPTFSIIRDAWQSENEGICLIDISSSDKILGETGIYVIHPSILDACLQSCFVPLGISLSADKSIVSVGFKTITLNGVPSSSQFYCHVIADENTFGKFDVTLMSPSGSVLVTMHDFRVAELTNSPRELAFAEVAYEVEWKENDFKTHAKTPPSLTCMVLTNSSDFSLRLIGKLQNAEVNVITVHLPNACCFDSEAENAIRAALSEIPAYNMSNLRLVNLWPLQLSLLPDNFKFIEQIQRLSFYSSAFLIKLLADKHAVGSRLFLVTEGTQLLRDYGKSLKVVGIPWGATVWGLKRAAALEVVTLRVTMVDLSNKEDQREVDALVNEILCDSTEDEVIFKGGKRFINRIFRSESPRISPKNTSTENYAKMKWLYLSTVPLTNTLCLREQSFSSPAPAEIAVDANYCWTFSQSLLTLTKPEGCIFISGKVTHLPGYSNPGFKTGEEVCGVIPSGRVSRFNSINARNLFLKPISLTMEQATCVPPCLALAYFAVQRASTDAINQNILIHQANHNPGPAAVALAKAMGHRVVCIIPDTCKICTHSFLLRLGANSVERQSLFLLNSNLTDHFDAVIFFSSPFPNSLKKSGDCLKKGGKLILLGAQSNGNVVFSANKSVEYVRGDVSDILRSPSAFEKLTVQSLELLERRGALKELLEMQVASVDLLSSIRSANNSRNVALSDKQESLISSDISLFIRSLPTFDEDVALQNIPVVSKGLDECGLKENRTYLVAGGMKGFGFEVACWMAENGAKTIVLLSRSEPSDAKRQQVREIEKRTGTKIYTFQVDISNDEQMSEFTEQLQGLPSVAGIVHTAMLLRDEFIKDLTFQGFSDVMGPKIKGSFLLHQMSLEMDLDFFVMFSSMASVVGNSGQSSYSACNAFQDALAQYRRLVLGLPGLTINWGPISGAGVMERKAGIAKLMVFAGLGFINAKEGVKHMAKVLREEPERCQIALFNADWPRFLNSNPGLQKNPRLSLIGPESRSTNDLTRPQESLGQNIIFEQDQDKREQLVNEYIEASLPDWLGNWSLTEVDMNKNLYSCGVDSTLALTIKSQLENDLQVSFEVFYFMQPDTTLSKMVKDINTKLRGNSPDSQAANEQPQRSDQQETNSEQILSQIRVVPLYTSESSAIKFFCVHPSHRYAMSLVPISTGFQGQDQVSFYALGFTDPTTVSEDWGGVRELATHYVTLISAEQRHGPYFLGGYSYGGMLAYEIASLLTEQNQMVGFLAMIDTFPWFSRSYAIRTRFTSIVGDKRSQVRHVEFQFENYMRKLAVNSLNIAEEEYQLLREEKGEEWVIDEIERRSSEKEIATYNLRSLKDSLLTDQSVAARTHMEWQPSEARYRGPLTFLKCQNTCFSPVLPSSESAAEIWGELVDGGTTVLVCPGDHYSMSDLPHAHVTGSILATALLFSYRLLFPEFPRPKRTFSQRRAVERLSDGVDVYLHAKKGNKRPHFGEVFFKEDAHKLEFRSKADEGERKEKKEIKKIIDLKALRMIQPGRFVSNALQYAGRKRRVGAQQSGNLGQIASVITNNRVYNLEFTDHSDLRSFFNTMEAVYGVTILSY